MPYQKKVTRLCTRPDCSSQGEHRAHYADGMCNNCYKRDRHQAGHRKNRAKRAEHDALGYTRSERNLDDLYRKSYGITLEQFREYESCAICGDGTRRLLADHNHATGMFRGALCHHCNVAIGLMSDDPDRLRAAVVYLERR